MFTNGGLGGHMANSHPKNGVPHPGAAALKNVWNGLSDEDHAARVKVGRDSRFSDLDDIVLTKTQEQMILGSLLGDMNIWRQHKGVSGISHPELRISHSVKQREYVWWKYEILKNIARKEPYEIIQKTGFGAGLGSCRFETKSLKCFEPIYDVVIGKDGKKHITQEWLDKIAEPIALATWYMDDGSRGCGNGDRIKPWFAMGLSTDNEVSIMRHWLDDTWGLKTSYRRARGYYNENTYAILQISLRYREKFKNIIETNVISSMRYKVDTDVSYLHHQ
jgi:hypothetical protein